MANRSRWHGRTSALTLRYPSGEFLLLEPTEGNYAIGGMNAQNFEDVQVRNRTKHDGHVEGPDLVQDISFTLEMPREVLTSAVAKTIMDAFLKKGLFAGATSVDPVIDGSWILDFNVTDGVIAGQIRCPEVTGEISFSEGAETNTLDFSGRCFQAPEWT